MARDIDAEEEDAPAPKGDVREKLKLAAHYAMLGFAPFVSIVALVVALFATGNHSDRAQLGELNSHIEKLNAGLSASREELENLKFSMSREKLQRADEHKRDDEREVITVQSITRLQEKLKIAPTLEEQLHAASGVHAGALPAVAGATAAPVAPAAPAAAEKTQAVPAPANSAKKPAAAIPAPKAEEKKKVAPAPKADEKMSPQVKALKSAIDQYNKQ